MGRTVALFTENYGDAAVRALTSASRPDYAERQEGSRPIRRCISRGPYHRPAPINRAQMEKAYVDGSRGGPHRPQGVTWSVATSAGSFATRNPRQCRWRRADALARLAGAAPSGSCRSGARRSSSRHRLDTPSRVAGGDRCRRAFLFQARGRAGRPDLQRTKIRSSLTRSARGLDIATRSIASSEPRP